VSETHKKSEVRDFFESLVVTVILAIFGTTFVVQAFKIPTGSMEDTILIGDHLLVNKFAYGFPLGMLAGILPYRPIRRDDIVVFKFPGPAEEAQEPGEHFVKRVIGLPGDRIRVENRQVYVNGQPVPQPFVRNAFPGQIRPGDNFPPPDSEVINGSTMEWSLKLANYVKNGELVVPPGEYFVMGDNREESWDSRFWGFVPRKLITGRPLFIYWSFETPPNEYAQTSFSDRMRQWGDLIFHFFTKTRWRRTFRMVK
jgi:signal peptidase I